MNSAFNSKKDLSSQCAECFKQCENEPQVEKKIGIAIHFMRLLLSQEGSFKDFWECQRFCSQLFKQNLPVQQRLHLWREYIDLTKHARQLKDLLNEESAFAAEQIELAIQSIEGDIEHLLILLNHAPDLIVIKKSVSLKEKYDAYNLLQKEILLLNTLAARIHSLRKEVVKTKMRNRVKNKLLQRLSTCGNSVFPKRKEVAQKISDAFMKDIDHFVQTYFHTSEIKELPLHILREEIQSLQAFAKILTLSAHAFTTTRLQLSTCWEQIKTQEKGRKKKSPPKKSPVKEIKAVLPKETFTLSETDLQSEEHLAELLQQRKQRRVEIKNKLEFYRKELGGSGLDFEKAMHYQEQVTEERAQLERIDASIEELENILS